LVDLNREARIFGMKINQAKTKAMRIKNKNKNTFILDGKEIENGDKSPYLGSVITKEGGCMEDVRNKISKTNGAFNQLQKVWKLSEISLRTKLRIFNSNLKSILLYGCETWQVTQEICKKNRCLCRIVKVRRPLTITNYELRKQTSEIKITEQVTRRKWNWIGHTL
jgi:hypothetical protein